MHDGQGFQTQEVHFQETHFINRAHVALGDDGCMRIRQVVTGERHMLVQRTVTNHDARRVHAHVADQPFQARRITPELRVSFIGGDQLPQFLTALVAGLEGYLGTGFNQLGNAVSIRVGHVHHAGHVPEHGLGAHGAVRDDVRHGALPVFLPHIVNHLRTARLAEVNVDIRRADALRVQETFKDQPEPQGVDVRDLHGIRHQRTGGGTAAGPHGNVMVLRPVDEIRRNQEVGGEFQLVDNPQLIIQAVAEFLVLSHAFFAVPLLQSFIAYLAQVILTRGAVRSAEFRVFFRTGGVQLDGDVAPFRDFQRVFHGVRIVPEHLPHFLGGFQVDFRGVAHALGRSQLFVGADADQHVVHVVVLLPEEVHVIGS